MWPPHPPHPPRGRRRPFVVVVFVTELQCNVIQFNALLCLAFDYCQMTTAAAATSNLLLRLRLRLRLLLQLLLQPTRKQTKQKTKSKERKQ